MSLRPFFRINQKKMTGNDFSVTIPARALHERQAVGYTTRKGVRLVPITLTVHIFGVVITIRVKRENRHSAK